LSQRKRAATPTTIATTEVVPSDVMSSRTVNWRHAVRAEPT
jgi:hypothetical protein